MCKRRVSNISPALRGENGYAKVLFVLAGVIVGTVP